MGKGSFFSESPKVKTYFCDHFCCYFLFLFLNLKKSRQTHFKDISILQNIQVKKSIFFVCANENFKTTSPTHKLKLERRTTMRRVQQKEQVWLFQQNKVKIIRLQPAAYTNEIKLNEHTIKKKKTHKNVRHTFWCE